MKINQQDSSHLVVLCKQQNQKAQFEIYNRYCKAMYNVALRIVKDQHFAEDIMQESFLKAFNKIDSYQGDVSFGAWLKRITINCSIDFYKKNNKNYLEDYNNAVVSVPEITEQNQECSDLQDLKTQHLLAALMALKESYRVVLTLFYIEGYDQEEISQIVGISASNCRTTLCRAKEKLRSNLKQI